MDSSPAKKRKRDDYEDDNITLTVSTATSSTGPVVVSFPAIQPPQKTAFKCYTRSGGGTQDSSAQGMSVSQTLIAGETDSVEFHTESFEEPATFASQYLIGIRDKSTNKVILRQAPLHVLSRDVKAFKSLDPLASPLANQERAQARNMLGQAFGSKKAQQAIRAMERNRVDVSAMEGVASILQDRIEAATESLPTKEAAKMAADENRPIPRYNLQAKTPDEVYALYDIIPEAEFNAISVTRMMEAPDVNAKIARLPYRRSSWLQQHAKAELLNAKPNKTNLKILYYISCMLLFRDGAVRDKAQLQKRMSSVPTEIVDGFLARFAESNRVTTKNQVTKQSETLLLTHMFALCLRLDRFATDPSLLSRDLSMSVQDIVKYFKQLGCKSDFLLASERTRLGLGPASEKEPKLCILRVPLNFLEQRLRKRK